MKKLLISLILSLCAPVAYAATCHDDLRMIDAALLKPGKIPAANIAEARKVRTQGATLCYGGKNAEARGVLRQALRLLDLG